MVVGGPSLLLMIQCRHPIFRQDPWREMDCLYDIASVDGTLLDMLGRMFRRL
jgi:hypothetical protein